MEYIWIGWLAFIVIAVIAEAASAALISIWFIPGAIVSLILSLFDVPLWVQFVVFAVISVLLLVFTRKFVKRFLKGKGERTNADAVIGQKA
ncbi:MAG: NfeD family protein, partial [Clostridia bacterium]|nr:NfeD family protein [Clostridia bacterium]